MAMDRPALIEPHDLSWMAMEKENIKILDGTFFMPGRVPSARTLFDESRIGQAGFFDIEDISDMNTPLPHMLPQPEDFERAVSRLGISNDDTVVVYGRETPAMGPCRVWWMFRVFGHEKVQILNGNMTYWGQEGFRITTDPPTLPNPSSFRAVFEPKWVKTLKQVQAAQKDGTAQIVDARSIERFAGTEPEPRTGLRSGHIPQSVNLPCALLFDPQTGRMNPPETLLGLFHQHHVNGTKPIITTCGSGVTACAIAFALHVLGFSDFSVYDGSWAEWGRSGVRTDVEQGVKTDA